MQESVGARARHVKDSIPPISTKHVPQALDGVWFGVGYEVSRRGRFIWVLDTVLASPGAHAAQTTTAVAIAIIWKAKRTQPPQAGVGSQHCCQRFLT